MNVKVILHEYELSYKENITTFISVHAIICLI